MNLRPSIMSASLLEKQMQEVPCLWYTNISRGVWFQIRPMLDCTFLLTAHFSHWRQQIILIFVELEDIASLSLTELSYQSIPTSPDTSTTPVSHHYTTEYSTATQPIPSANSLGTCQPCNWSITTADLAWSLHDNNKIGQNRLAFCKKNDSFIMFFL